MVRKLVIFGLLAAFAYAGFVPPEGMRKFPIAKIEFHLKTPKGNISAPIGEARETKKAQEEKPEVNASDS